MTKNDYIEKITQNLEHLTKDELKDVSILTTAQYGVRLKFAERQQLEHEIANLTPQLQQQALPVVPECVGELFNEYRFENIQRLFEFGIDDIKSNKMTKALKWRDEHPDIFALAFITGKYEVEKPQLFYLKNKMTGLNLVLEQSFNATGKHVGERFREFDMQYIATDKQEARLYKNTFSKAEIDSMQTGSYEQIEVEK